MERRLAAIMATDVVGYSRLIRADEEGTIVALQALRADLIDPKIAEHHGRIVKLMGDGMLVEFASVVDAVNAAVETQQAVTERNSDVPADRRIELRIGINLGDVVIDGDDIQGDGVNVAARLEGIAEPGGICLSGMVYESVRDRIDVPFEDLGEQEIKNIDRPVRVWRWSPTTRQPTSQLPSDREPSPVLDRPSIAVLPFENMSGDPEQEYFADGLVEDIITALSRIKAFFVIARNSSFTYKGVSVDIQRVGQELGVRYVLEGSVRRSGQRLRVTAQLIDATTGEHVWAERYDRELSDIFDVQDEITRNVVATTQTQVQLSEGSLFGHVEKPSLPIWALVSRSWKLMYELTSDSLSEAISLAEEAVALDPNSGRAHQALAVNLWHLNWMGFAKDGGATFARGRKIAERAARLNDDDEYTHWILGLIQMENGEYDKAIAELERAIEINPNCSLAYGSLATVLNFAGRPEDALGNNEIAIRSNPRDPSIFFRYSGLAWSNYLLKRLEIATEWAKKSIQHKPGWFQSHVVLVASLVELERLDVAKEALGDYLRQFPNSSLAEITELPFRMPEHRARLLDALRKIGLPE